MKKIIILCIFVFFEIVNLSAQQLPTIIPPSPVAQNFMRYGEIPVNYSTGVPSIEIPIYTIEGKKLKLPISISYHASGIKVEDVASEVGLGWVLNCGGMISRTIYERPDEECSGAKTYNNASQLLSAVATIAPVYDNTYEGYLGIDNLEFYFSGSFNAEDPMSDRFYYSLPNGVSGVFRLDQLNQNNVITLPFRPLKIEKTVTPPPLGGEARIVSFKITDENGIVYTFTSFNGTSWKTTEWYLTKMTSADGTDNIDFNYNYTSQVQGAYSSTFSLASHTQDLGENCLPNYNVYGYISPVSTITETPSQLNRFDAPVLQSIVSSTAVINFTYLKDRSDFNQLYRLSTITVSSVNSPSTVIKSINFSPKYFGSNNTDYRLGLDNVTISAPGITQPQKYTFTYESLTLPPYPVKMSTERFNVDFWGYYNNSNSPTLIQSDFILSSTDRTALGGNREADNGDYARACMIKEIKYPTGGKTVFHFDRNYATNIYTYKNNPDGYVGGFRVGTITNYNEKNEVVNVKSYEYSGVQARPITKMLFEYTMHGSMHHEYMSPEEGDEGGWKAYCWIQSTDSIVLSDPVLPLEVGSGLPIMYTNVTEYNGTNTNNAGKTVYEYNQPYSSSDFDSNPEHPFQFEEPRFYTSSHYDKGNYVPELISKTEYSFDGTNYHPISKVNNEYTKLSTQEFQTGIKLTRTQTFPSVNGRGYFPGLFYGSFVQDYIHSYAAVDSKAYQEASLVTKTDNYIYNPTDQTKYVLNTTNFEYDPVYLQLTRQTNSTSVGGKNKITQFTYPFQYSTAPYTSMVQKNDVVHVIEQSDLINTTFLKSLKTDYYNWGNNIIAPITVQTKQGSSDYSTRIRYHSYDNQGNVTSVSKESGPIITYIYSYGGLYPVAKIENADYSTVETILGGSTAVENFRNTLNPTDASVNSFLSPLRNQLSNAQITTYTYSPLIGMTSQTDPKGMASYYKYDSFNRLAQILDNNNKFLKDYTYHYYYEPAPVLYYNIEQSQAFTRINCSSGCTAGPPVTYTVLANRYSSTISQADANALALADINANGQAYANTNGTCIYYSRYNSGTFTKNDCSSGFVGSEVLYSVSAGTYTSTISQADADSKSAADINANAQAYANAHGTCIPHAFGTINWYFSQTFSNDADSFKIYVNGVLHVNINTTSGDTLHISSGDVIRVEVSIAGVDYAGIGAYLDVVKTNDYSTSYYDSGYVTNLTETYQFTWNTSFGDLDISGGSDFLGVYD